MPTTYREGRPPFEHDGATPEPDPAGATTDPPVPSQADMDAEDAARRAASDEPAQGAKPKRASTPKATPAVKAAVKQPRARASGKSAGKTKR